MRHEVNCFFLDALALINSVCIMWIRLKLYLSLNLENAMVFDDLIVELAEDALVIVDQPKETASNVTKFTLADSEPRRNLELQEQFIM